MIKKELQQELNRTKLVLDYARQEIKEKDKEIERLNSIIKEVREYIDYFLKEGHTKNWKQFEYSLLEILDKADKGE